MNATAVGALLGGCFAAGLSLCMLVARRRVDVAQRILPFVRLTEPDVFNAEHHAPALNGAAAKRGALKVMTAVFGEASTRGRLERAGLTPNVEQFRISQLRWACAVGIGAIGFGLVKIATGNALAPVPWLLMCALGAASGAMLKDQLLSRAARKRVELISSQLPAFAELLAFTVGAGLAPASALNRVANRVGGELAVELRRCTDETAAGRNLADALQAVAERTGSAAVQRFVDGIVVAMERGTPVSEVLRAQAMDARDSGHRALMESAGKREIYALVPVVFLILPIVVLVAVFPGINGLLLAA